jgi:hypothetical protein
MVDLRASLDGLYESQIANAHPEDKVVKARPSMNRKARMGQPWYEDDKKMQFYHEGEDYDNNNDDVFDSSEERMYEAFLKSEHLLYDDFVEEVSYGNAACDSSTKSAKRETAAEGAEMEYLNKQQIIAKTPEKFQPENGVLEPAEELAKIPKKETVSNNFGGGHGEQDEGDSRQAAMDTAPLLKCLKCEVTFSNQLELDNHVMAHMGTDPDAASGQAGGDQTTLGAYILAAHSVDQDQNLPCKHYDQICPTQQKLDEHIAVALSDNTKAARILKTTKK